MEPIGPVTDSLPGNLGMLKATLADFSDQDMLVRPVPAANHALWQLGHPAISEGEMLAMAGYPDVISPAPADWAAKFNRDNRLNNDPAYFPPKAEVLAYFERVRALSDAELAKPLGPPLNAFAPTFGQLVLAYPRSIWRCTSGSSR